MLSAVFFNTMFINLINNVLYYFNIYYILLIEKSFFIKLNLKNSTLCIDNIFHPLVLISLYLVIIKNIFLQKSSCYKIIFSIFFLILAFVGGMFWFFKTKQKIWLWDTVELIFLFLIFLFLILLHLKLVINITYISFFISLFIFYFFISFSNHKFTTKKNYFKNTYFFIKKKFYINFITLKLQYYTYLLLPTLYMYLRKLEPLFFILLIGCKQYHSKFNFLKKIYFRATLKKHVLLIFFS